MEEVFGPDGLIARYHPNYEYRPGQVEMAEAVNDALTHGGTALIEAGTGTGKTLAYLIPALASGHRVIVATATKNLQEQLHKKDIPFLQEIIPRKFKAVCMKGRSNYVCLHRLKKADETPILEGLDEVDYFDEIRRWAAESETGDRAELVDLPEDLSFWPQIDARAETCLGQKCPEYDSCFITRMRQEAQEADVVIVNHHLFFADLALRGGDYGAVLPDYSNVIFDEAHEIEDVAASYFGASVSNYRVNDLLQDVQKLVITEPDASMEMTKAMARLAQRADTFWLSFRGDSFADAGETNQWQSTSRSRPRAANQQDGRYTLSESFFARANSEGDVQATAAGEAYIALSTAIDRLAAALALVRNPPPELDNILRRAQSLKFDLQFVVTGDEPGFVYWCGSAGAASSFMPRRLTFRACWKKSFFPAFTAPC